MTHKHPPPRTESTPDGSTPPTIPLAAVMVLALTLLSILTAGCRPAPAPKITRIRYVSLGDSIAAGWGASDPAHSLTGLFAAYLRHTAPKNSIETVTSLGAPGLNSAGLLHELQTKPAARAAVHAATVITISIGGNDLLPCASPLAGGVDTACAESHLRSFKSNWAAILREIRDSIGSRARIYVLNLYDVYPIFIPGRPVADHVVRQLNEMIRQHDVGSPQSYRIVDLYTAFNAGDLCTLTHVCSLPPDPHPTDAGYRLMARLLEREEARS